MVGYSHLTTTGTQMKIIMVLLLLCSCVQTTDNAPPPPELHSYSVSVISRTAVAGNHTYVVQAESEYAAKSIVQNMYTRTVNMRARRVD